jgi:predicted Zn-dependent protease
MRVIAADALVSPPMSTIEAETRAEPLTLDATLQAAVGQHRAGNPVEAERLYRDVLAEDPTHAFANHNLGIVKLQTRRPGEALRHLKAALHRGLSQPRYRRSYADGLMSLRTKRSSSPEDSPPRTT